MPPEVVIRLAAPGERELLEDLQRSASLALDDYREALLENPDAIALPAEQIVAGQVHVAQSDRLILGFMVLVPTGSGGLELDGLFIDPNSWRRGVGRALIARAREIAGDEGVHAITVVASPTARNFYEACGFVLTGTAPTRFGPALAMRWAG
jgi:GNAT superfamily N-acetyltransferase